MKRKLFTSVWLLFSLQVLIAGDLDRLGTTSGTQLIIPVGARSLAMGGGPIGNIAGAEAIFWNPAGIPLTGKSEVLFNYMRYIADIDVNYLALVFNGGSIGAFGLHIKSLSFGDIVETTEALPDGTGNTYSPTFIITGLTYSRLLTDRITAGVTGKVLYESIMETSASALALDFGVQYAFNNNLSVGVTMKNVGSKMQYRGRNLERQYEQPSSNLISDDGYFEGIPLTSDIPSTFSIGATYVREIGEENSVLLNGTFTNNNTFSDVLFGGIEYTFKNLFFLRGGYSYQAQNSRNSVFGISAGAGIKYPVGSFDFTLDYAFRQITDYFNNSNIFTVKIGL
jgi:opacity protein-like surface antigen